MNQNSQSNGKDVAYKYLISMLGNKGHTYTVPPHPQSVSSIKCA